MLRLLLQTESVEVNAEDLRGQLTPLSYAAEAGAGDAVQLLLAHGADPDVHDIRPTIAEKLPQLDLTEYVSMVKARPIKQRLFECVETGDINGLRRLSKKQEGEIDAKVDWNMDNGAMTLMQLACVHGREAVVAFLLDETDCDPNRTAVEGRTPALIAAHHGFFGILDTLKKSEKVDFSAVEASTGKTVLHEVLRGDSVKVPTESSSYRKSLQVLLSDNHRKNLRFSEQITRIINYRECLDGDTALHYATSQADQDIVMLLLRRGANMGVKNFREKTPVQAILPETLEQFLTEDCVRGDGVVTDEKFKITFVYDFLAPPLLGKTNEEESDTDRPLPETESLWYLSQASREHRALLKHPALASFLWLKWQRIRTLFYINLVLYLAFVTLLTAYIFIRFGGTTIQPSISANEAFNGANPKILAGLRIPIVVLLVVLALRELFQALVSLKRYLFSPENLCEVAIIVLSAAILKDPADAAAFERGRHMAAICVLLSWTETLVLIGRHPRLSTNVTMLTTVVATFLKFLLWYGMVVVAFGIAFYIMLHRDHANAEPNDEYPFFDGAWMALFKTSAMFVGELEFADLPFTDNPVSRLVFLAFVFLVVVVLMNLLNGLAVSDTGLIREEAEVVGWAARVELITYTESMLLGDPFYFLSNWPPLKLLKKIPSCAVCRFLYKFPRVRDFLQKVSGGAKILLFYSCLPSKRVSFYPNTKATQRGFGLLGYKRSLKVEHDRVDEECGKSKWQREQQQQQKLEISNDVMDAAKALVIHKLRLESEEKERAKRQEELDNRLTAMEELLLRLSSK